MCRAVPLINEVLIVKDSLFAQSGYLKKRDRSTETRVALRMAGPL